MPPDADAAADARRACADAGCSRPADFWRYDAPAGSWEPQCTRHLLQAHPSLEVRAWLEGGYARPVEVGRPAEPPGEPSTGRAAAFRKLVESAMGWSTGGR